jgi:hypothetical protein
MPLQLLHKPKICNAGTKKHVRNVSDKADVWECIVHAEAQQANDKPLLLLSHKQVL